MKKTIVEELCATHNCLFNLVDLKKYIYDIRMGLEHVRFELWDQIRITPTRR